MSFNNVQRRVVAAVFASLISVSAFAKGQEKPESRCTNWIVEGVPFDGATNWLSSKWSTPAANALEFPLPYVLANLGLKRWVPEAWRLVAKVKSKPQLLWARGLENPGELLGTAPTEKISFMAMGNGRGALLPFATGSLFDATSVDSSLDRETGEVDAFLDKYYYQTVGGSPTNLRKFANDSRDMVVSHQLLSRYNSISDRLAILRESFRVLKPGATARHSIVVPDVTEFLRGIDVDSQTFKDELGRALGKLVLAAFPGGEAQAAVFVDKPTMRLSPWHNSIGDLVDTDVSGPVTYDELYATAQPLENVALNVLIVLRKPEGVAATESADSSWSWFNPLSWLG